MVYDIIVEIFIPCFEFHKVTVLLSYYLSLISVVVKLMFYLIFHRFSIAAQLFNKLLVLYFDSDGITLHISTAFMSLIIIQSDTVLGEATWQVS